MLLANLIGWIRPELSIQVNVQKFVEVSLQALWDRWLFRCWASLLVMIGKRFANQPGQLVPARVGYVGQHGVAARAAAGQLWTLSSWPAMDSEASTTSQLSFYAAAAVPPSPVCSTQSLTPRLQLDQFFFLKVSFLLKKLHHLLKTCAFPCRLVLVPNVLPVSHKS